MALVVIGLVAAIAVPSYSAIVQRQKISQAVHDLQEIVMGLERYRTQHFAYPETLDDLNLPAEFTDDPWGRPYQYLNFESSIPGIKGKIRKDHNLHPLNSDFDLYSVGKDGQSKSPLTAKPSRDDVIWARDGGFVGLAEDY